MCKREGRVCYVELHNMMGWELAQLELGESLEGLVTSYVAKNLYINSSKLKTCQWL